MSGARWPGLVLLCLVSGFVGCGGPTVVDCSPICAAGTRCESGACVPDTRPADMSVGAADLAPPCECAAPTPHCTAQRQCVACLENSHCPAGQVCRVGTLGNTCVPGCTDDRGCGGALKCCNGACVDTTKNPQNCGACGSACMSANGAAACVAGQCTAGTCNAGYGDCNMDPKDGCETNLRVDTANCKACGAKCSYPNAVAGCASGCYLRSCNFGWADCNMKPADGCEVRVDNDLRNCGACGKVCPAPARTKVVCDVGRCLVTGCDPGFADCDGNATNGCEIVIDSDVKNCGACGNACPANTACVAGVCTCKPCSYPNASAACINFQCALGACNPGFGDCNNNPADGCELPLNADAKNCGACGRACAQGLVCVLGSCTCQNCNIPNATSSCVNNQCVLNACLAGFANCDGAGANGCEVDTRSDAKNCGGCGVACPMNAPFCTNGQCNNILKSCLDYSKGGGQKSGVYMIDPDGAGPTQPFQVYCDMTMDGGGWTLALARKVDDAFPGVNGKSLTWDCLTSSAAPTSPTVQSNTVLAYAMFSAINPSDMLLMAGNRILKFYYPRPNGVPFVNNYRYLTERSCFEAMAISDAPNSGGSRNGCGHTNDACTTTDYAIWKVHDPSCPRDATNSHRDGTYCGAINCGSWGNCPGGGVAGPNPAPNCWFYGGNNACGVPSISNCPQQSRAPWADYSTGTLTGYYTLWIR